MKRLGEICVLLLAIFVSCADLQPAAAAAVTTQQPDVVPEPSSSSAAPKVFLLSPFRGRKSSAFRNAQTRGKASCAREHKLGTPSGCRVGSTQKAGTHATRQDFFSLSGLVVLCSSWVKKCHPGSVKTRSLSVITVVLRISIQKERELRGEYRTTDIARPLSRPALCTRRDFIPRRRRGGGRGVFLNAGGRRRTNPRGGEARGWERRRQGYSQCPCR